MARPRLALRASALARRLLGHRLVQFALLGGAIFAIAPKPRPADVIEVTTERLAALHAADAVRPAGTATPAERAREVDQRAIEDEILYREGVRLGLDKNDGIVRQRVVQKVLFLAEEMAGASRPADEAALRAFFEANRERWAMSPEVRFAQVFRHSPEALAAWLRDGANGEPPLGEPSPVAAEVDMNDTRLAQSLGADFASSIMNAPVGVWSGPVRSAYGFHLVRVIEKKAGRSARLDEVRASVLEAFSVHRRQEATATFLRSAASRYRVTIDGKPLEGFTPSHRVAFRSVSSGED